MGFSIGKVFKPVIERISSVTEVDSIELPCANYSPTSLWHNVRFARKAASLKHYDIIHITGAEHYLLPFLTKYKTVITVHDLGFYTNHKKNLWLMGKYLLWIKSLKCANYITFISEKTEREVQRLVHLKDGHHGVVPNAIGTEFHYVKKEINIHHPIILHVGTKTNKNLENTAIALNDYPCKLRIIGRLKENQISILNSNSIDYESVSNLTDEEILQEYINCDYVNFPSLYEGFGMPIIEGQAVGRPILTSNISPMKEIAGEGAVLVDPTNPKSIRQGFYALSQETDNLIRKGLENVKNFSINNVTKQYLEIYKQLIR